MCLGLSYNLYIKLRGRGEDIRKRKESTHINHRSRKEIKRLPPPTTNQPPPLSSPSTAITCFMHHLLLLLPLLLATPPISSPILILTNCGKYTSIYLSFYFLLKQDKLGLCILYLLCVYESYSVRVRQLLLYFFIYCIDFPCFQENAR